MTVFGSLFGRARRPRPLQVQDGDAFASICDRSGITPREAEIIRRLLEGKSNREITAELFISDHTVKNHIHNIYRKLGIRNRVQLVQHFHGAIEEPGPPAAESAAPAPRARKRSRARWLVPGSVLALVGVAVIVVIVTRPHRPDRALSPFRPVLAILDFENLAGDAEMQKWTNGVPILLAANLSQSRYFRTLGDDIVFGTIRKLGLDRRPRRSRDELRHVAGELKADYLVTGTLMAAGGPIVVTAVLQDGRTGEPLRTDRVECRDERDLMRKVDDLSRLVRAGLNLPGAPSGADIIVRAEAVTTSSPLAFKYYAEGRRYHLTGDNEKAMEMQTRAIEIDPKFAMAYWGLALDARNIANFEREASFMKRAFELSAGLPEDSRERHLIRADYYCMSEGTYGRAEDEYRVILANHPDDPVVNNNMAMLCAIREDFEGAISCAGVPIGQDSDYPFAYYTAAVSLGSLNRPQEALRLLESYHARFPANRLVWEAHVATLLTANDWTGAIAAVEKARAILPDPIWNLFMAEPLFQTRGAEAARAELRPLLTDTAGVYAVWARRQLGQIALAEGQFREAEAQFRAGAELAEAMRELRWAAFLRELLGELFLNQERVPAALAEAWRAVEHSATSAHRRDGRVGLRLQGLASLRAGDLATVDRVMEKFKSMAVPGAGIPATREYDFFWGAVELERGRAAEAVKILGRAATLLPPGDADPYGKSKLLLALAGAREKAGDFAGAALAYETILNAPGNRIPAADMVPRAVLGRARAQDRLGRRDRAVAGYRSFLEMWKNADPGRPEVEEAAARLKALSAAPPTAPEPSPRTAARGRPA